MNETSEQSLPAASRRNPFWVCLVVFLALAVDGGFRLMRSMDQRRQLHQLQLTQVANIGRLSSVLAQSRQVETKLQAVSLDLIRVARTNGLAAQLVREFNIQYTPGAETAAPALVNPVVNSAPTEAAPKAAPTSAVPK